MSGPTVICRRGPMRAANCPERAEKREHDDGHREQGQSRVERAVLRDQLQLDGQEEEGTAQRAIDHERHGVGAGELVGAEDVEGQHWIGPPVLRHQEGRTGDAGQHQAAQDAGAGPAVGSVPQ